jgi:hypothetical protein
MRFSDVKHDEIGTVTKFGMQPQQKWHGARGHGTCHRSEYQQKRIISQQVLVDQAITVCRDKLKCRERVTWTGRSFSKAQVVEE